MASYTVKFTLVSKHFSRRFIQVNSGISVSDHSGRSFILHFLISHQSLVFEQVTEHPSPVLVCHSRRILIHHHQAILTSPYLLLVHLLKVQLFLNMEIFLQPSSPPPRHIPTPQLAIPLHQNNGCRIQDHKALLDDLCFLTGK
jgi:hypothetical protein